MDRVTVDRIRRVSFPVARRGYRKRAVDRFHDRLAAWLETGQGDPARADLLRRELARVGHRTAAILAEAEEAAERLRAEAEQDAVGILRRAREEAARIREVAQEDTSGRAAVAQRPERRRPAPALSDRGAR